MDHPDGYKTKPRTGPPKQNVYTATELGTGRIWQLNSRVLEQHATPSLSKHLINVQSGYWRSNLGSSAYFFHARLKVGGRHLQPRSTAYRGCKEQMETLYVTIKLQARNRL